MLELYHNVTSTCSQKARLTLAEKGLEWTSHEIDLLGGGQHDAEYAKLNPDHVVPTLVADGLVVLESTLINEYLDDAFPEPPLRPADAAGRFRMRHWTKHMDDKAQPAIGIVTYAIGVRPLLLGQDPEALEARLAGVPDPARRARLRSAIEHGVAAPEIPGAISVLVATLDRMEKDLATYPWLTGPTFSLADICVLPYVLRIDHLGLTPLIAESARPQVADWYRRIRERPSFETAIGAVLPEGLIELFQGAGREVWPQLEPLIA